MDGLVGVDERIPALPKNFIVGWKCISAGDKIRFFGSVFRVDNRLLHKHNGIDVGNRIVDTSSNPGQPCLRLTLWVKSRVDWVL